jgi:hypothetical protein
MLGWIGVFIVAVGGVGVLFAASGKRFVAESSAQLASSVPTGASERVTGTGLAVLRRPERHDSEAGNLVKDGKGYLIVEQYSSPCNGRDRNARHEMLEHLLSDACLFGPRCLAFEGFAADDGCGNDRIEVDLASSQSPAAMRFDEPRYLRFFLKVDPGLGALRNAPLISQIWQQSSVEYGNRPALGPAFAISITADAQDETLVDVDFRYRNEISEENPPHFFVHRPIKKGEWHAFHVRMLPRFLGHPNGRGEILVWFDQGLDAVLDPTRAINYSSVDDSSYRFYWGYVPDPQTRLGGTFDVRVGLYRAEPLVSTKFWLDAVKLARDSNSLRGL